MAKKYGAEKKDWRVLCKGGNETGPPEFSKFVW